MAKDSETSSRKNSRKMQTKEIIETTTLSATMAVSSMNETGLKHVQVLPDNPRAGTVGTFRGLGYGQMLSTGQFEFTQQRIPRSCAETLCRLPHLTLSKCKDKTHRLTFIVRDSDIESFCRYLIQEVPQAISFMDKYIETYKNNGGLV